jgi:hypothetical protein
MGKIKLWQFNDVDWVAAETQKDAEECFASVMDPDLIDRDEIRELTEEEMNRLIFLDDPYNPDESGKRSFREELDAMVSRGEAFPSMFATSEY